MFTAAGQWPNSRQASVDQMEIAGAREIEVIAVAD